MSEGYKLSEEAVRKLADTIRRVDELSRTVHFMRRNDTPRRRTIVDVKLSEALAEPYDPETMPSTARAVILRQKYDIADDPADNQLVDSEFNEITVTNRRSGFSASEGEVIQVSHTNREWRPLGGGGGGPEIVYFETVAFCYGINLGAGCSCLEAVITRVPCTSAYQVGDGITLWDPDRCYFNLPADLLLGMRGRAILMRTGDDLGGAHCVQTPDIDECMWVVDGLCCREEDYYG